MSSVLSLLLFLQPARCYVFDVAVSCWCFSLLWKGFSLLWKGASGANALFSCHSFLLDMNMFCFVCFVLLAIPFQPHVSLGGVCSYVLVVVCG